MEPGRSLEAALRLEAIGKDAVGTFHTNYWTPDLDIPANKKFVAAFQKKSEFGPGSIDVRGFRTRDMTVQHLVEEGSRVTIDGRRVAASDDHDIREILYGE